MDIIPKPVEPNEYGNPRIIGEPRRLLGNYGLDFELIEDLAKCMLNGISHNELHFRDQETNS